MNNLYKAVHRTVSFHFCPGAIAPHLRRISISGINKLQNKNESNQAAGIQRTKPSIIKITLISPNQALTVTSLDEAQKLAKRRDLHLIRLQKLDSKTQRPLYKLATAAEMINDDDLGGSKQNDMAAEKDKSSQKKSDKSLTIGSRISEHDLASRLKNISKWLVKRHEVRILIQGNADDISKSEQIIKKIEQYINEPVVTGKIVQKRNKGSVIKFSILPVTMPVSSIIGQTTNQTTTTA